MTVYEYVTCGQAAAESKDRMHCDQAAECNLEDAIRNARAEAGLTLSELAEEIGCSLQFISSMECCKRYAHINSEKFIRMCNILDLEVEEDDIETFNLHAYWNQIDSGRISGANDPAPRDPKDVI